MKPRKRPTKKADEKGWHLEKGQHENLENKEN